MFLVKEHVQETPKMSGRVGWINWIQGYTQPSLSGRLAELGKIMIPNLFFGQTNFRVGKVLNLEKQLY